MGATELARRNFGNMSLEDRITYVQTHSHGACDKIANDLALRLKEVGMEDRLVRSFVAAFQAGYGAGAAFGVSGVDVNDHKALGYSTIIAIKTEWERT